MTRLLVFRLLKDSSDLYAAEALIHLNFSIALYPFWHLERIPNIMANFNAF
jgi:hypothetical protein